MRKIQVKWWTGFQIDECLCFFLDSRGGRGITSSMVKVSEGDLWAFHGMDFKTEVVVPQGVNV